jgi:hypothetical protein
LSEVSLCPPTVLHVRASPDYFNESQNRSHHQYRTTPGGRNVRGGVCREARRPEVEDAPPFDSNTRGLAPVLKTGLQALSSCGQREPNAAMLVKNGGVCRENFKKVYICNEGGPEGDFPDASDTPRNLKGVDLFKKPRNFSLYAAVTGLLRQCCHSCFNVAGCGRRCVVGVNRSERHFARLRLR